MNDTAHHVADAGGVTSPLLEVAGIGMRFGGIVALDAVTFQIARGLIVGLIGPNGAGKTTLFNCLSRLYRPHRGDIRLNGRSLRQCAAPDIAALGIGRVAVLGVLGDDGFAHELTRSLNARGISTDLLVRSAKVPTFTYTKLINIATGVEDLPRVDFINSHPLPATG